MSTPWQTNEPSRAEIDATAGATLLEFGSPGCGYCRAAQPLVEQALGEQPQPPRHLKVVDGPGRPLGRSFRVKLWPTLVFLRDGREVARLVRPTDVQALRDAIARVSAPG